MRPFAQSLAGIVLLGSVSLAGERTARLEDIMKSILATMDKVTTTLGTIQDKDTAEAAHPELKKSSEEMVLLRKRAENVRPPTKEEKERLVKEYKAKLEESQKKLLAEITRVAAVPGGKEVLLEVNKVFRKSP